MNLVKIPRGFYDFHVGLCGLLAPVLVVKHAYHFEIDTGDPAFGELAEHCRYFLDDIGHFKPWPGGKTAARALRAALEQRGAWPSTS